MIAALEADVVAARQDAAARFTTVRELKQMLKVAREDAQKKDTVIAEQQAKLKASEDDKEAMKAELAALSASKACCCAGPQLNGTSFFVRSCSGRAIFEKSLIKRR